MQRFESFDRRVVAFLARHGVTALRVAVGLIFVWFGGLKFVPGLSPAEDLATRTVTTLSFGLVPPNAALILIALLETAIGVGLLTGLWLRATLALLAFQLVGTMTPLVLFPSEAFRVFPVVPTLEGQYILKNLVLAGAGLVMGATVRGGRMQAEPARAKRLQSTA